MLVVDHFNNNQDDTATENEYKKIRLGFSDRNGYHRQILMGFMEEKATSGIDSGYDAFLLDNQPSDMYFYNGGANLNISGEGAFDINSIYPLGVKTDGLGNVTFSLDGLENFQNNDINVYIHDNTTDIYHDITTEDVTLELPLGVVNDRFSMRFITAEQALGITDLENSNAIQIAYTSSNDMLNIKNNLIDATVEKVELYNMLGQAIGTWTVKDQAQNNIQLPIKNISTATYIVKIKTTKGDTSRKIIIN
jgi:trimeric autotransporter adhesin